MTPLAKASWSACLAWTGVLAVSLAWEVLQYRQHESPELVAEATTVADREEDSIGGMSVSAPAGPFRAANRAHLLTEAASYALLWLLGLLGISYGARRLSRSEEARLAGEETAHRHLEAHRDALEAEVVARTRDLRGANEKLAAESDARLRGERVTLALNRLLALSLSEEPLERTLQACLEEILSIPWLSVLSKGAVFLADRKSRTLKMAAEKSLAGAVKSACSRVAFGRCLCGKAAAAGEVQHASGLDERHETAYGGIHPHGHYCVPIMLSGETAGVLTLYINEGHAFDEHEAGFLKSAADVLAGIIRHKSEERRSRMLAEVASAVALAGDSRAAMLAALEAVCRGTGWLCGDAWIPSDDGGTIEFAASFSADGPDMEAFRNGSSLVSFKPGEGLPGRVLAGKAPVVIGDVAADPDFPRAGLAARTGVRSAMGVPVLRGGEPVAILGFYATSEAAFDQEDVGTAALAAAQVAPLILRRRAEDRLKSSQRSLAEAQALAAMGSWELDLATGSVEWSDELYRINGIPVGEKVSVETFRAGIHPDERELVQRRMIDSLDQGRDFDLVRRVVRRDGAVLWVRDIGTVVRAPDGKPVKYRGTAQDVTAHKALEEQLGQAQKMDAVGRLAGGVAHDFNNLLTSIQGFAEFLIGSLAADDPRKSDAEEIRQAALRAAGLTRQLLAFSRKAPVSPREADVNRLVLDMGKLLKRLLGEHIEISLDLAPSLPKVLADPGQLEQVVMNLAVNARDAMPKGGRLVISTRSEPPGPGTAGQVALEVRDTGHGMEEAVRSRIFEPFFTTKGPGKGTGLGLSIVYSAVQQARGSIAVESAPGKGAAFIVRLPALEEGPERGEVGPEPAAPSRGSELVLIVDDDETVARTAARMLERLGYEVILAPGPAEARALAAKRPGPIRLVLTDVVMPGMSGVELAAALSAAGLEAKVLFMTGYADRDLPVFKELGKGLPVVDKPFSQGELGRRVREVLDS